MTPLSWIRRRRTPRPPYTEVPSGTPGLTRLMPGPRAAREAEARARVRTGLRIGDPAYCYPCHYGFLLSHARSQGSRGEWSLAVREYEAALDELRLAEAQECICPEPDQARQEAHRVNAPWA